ncbi:MAG: YggS family pyridoxal phosphate-dependent enzyme [Psychrobium sp.]|nr:YggS family pyridoxal phosphate-dependent enzyme [Psychrobium sp.]
MTTITDRLHSAINNIKTCEKKCLRNSQSVQLIAVSKTKPNDDIAQAIDAGQRHFGENYVQEGIEKVAFFNDPQLVWHFIGPIQSNKTKLVAASFDWVHTIDRLKIAQRLSNQRPREQGKLNVCLQVNISGEQNKSGIKADEVMSLAQEVAKLDNLTLRGLMTIGQKSDDVTVISKQFSQMNQLFETLKKEFATVDTLSMGMSGDLQCAIENGATMVRIGRAIFGQRTDIDPK